MAQCKEGIFTGVARKFTGMILLLVWVWLVAVWFPAPAQALEVSGSEKKEVLANEYGRVWVGLGYLTGDVTYQIGGKFRANADGQIIGGKQHFPISELKWPLDMLMLSVGGELRFLKKGELRAAFSKNLTDRPGKIEDTDWETDLSSPHDKTIFGTSDTAFSGYVLDLGARYWLLEQRVNQDFAWALAPGLGLLYQEFSWDGSNLVQTDLITGDVITQAGPTIAYKFNLLMPMLDLAGKLTYKRLSFLASFGFSPKLIAKDKDFHLLRDRFTKTKAYGYGFKLGWEGRYELSRHWFLHWSGDWLWIRANDMDQNWQKFGNIFSYIWSIEHRLTSTQFSLRGGVGFKF
ncbi:MAG: omptin family outer membrane protease [Thermodesulfobacteriota bacterium]